MKKLYIALAITFAAVTPALAGDKKQAGHITVRFSLGQTIESEYAKLPQAIKQATSIEEYRTQGMSTAKGQDDYEQRLGNATKGGGKHK